MSSAAAGEPPRSASAIVAATTNGYHLLKIDGYSRTKDVPTGDKLESRPFAVGGHRWHINYYRNGDRSESADCISLYLALDEDVTTPVKVRFRFCFVDEVKDQAPTLASAIVKGFVSHQCMGHRRFIKREILEKSEHLNDDSFTIRCDVIIINDYRAEDLPENTAPTFVTVAPSDLHRHLGNLLKTEKGADVVLEVGGETFATFAAHRCVLAARSPVFSAELFGMMKEGNVAGVIRIDDMEAKVFKVLLCFAYTDSLPVTEEGEGDVMCQRLLVAADRYNMDRLKSICEEKLCKFIDVLTVANILTLAEQNHCDGLKKACYDFLGSPANLKAFVASDGFDHLSMSCPSVVRKLVSMLQAP